MSDKTDPDNIGEYLISARSYEEYVAMFCLTAADLDGSILDCPGGGASFVAAACRAGSDAMAVDPAYGQAPESLARTVIEETGRGSAHTIAGADRYVWDYYGSPQRHREIREGSARVFGRDLTEHPERYLDAGLPELPFDDDRFDLVLSSHFLFMYADRLDPDFHRRALIELNRVSRGEVRVFPLLDYAGRSLPGLVRQLMQELSAIGIMCTIRESDYEFQRGGNEMLVLTGGGRRGCARRARADYDHSAQRGVEVRRTRDDILGP